VDVGLVQRGELTAQFAQREVGHADARERTHGVISAFGTGDGWREGRADRGVVEVEAAQRRVPNKNVQRMLWSASGNGLQGVRVDDNKRQKRRARWLERLKDGYDVCRASDADDFRKVDDLGEDFRAPIRVDSDERLVVETAGELKEQPVVAIPAADAEELAPFRFEVKRHASCCAEGIVANLFESFEFEDAFRYLRDGVVDGGACGQPEEALGGAQGESIVKCF
jgi:hypothetical protein